jgi:photosystem II stability/assembly factor-like uncharacterized protein
MIPNKLIPVLLLWLASSAVAMGTAVPAHDLYLCASVNGNARVIGFKDSGQNGVFRREADGGFSHLGLNHPMMVSVAFDPRDPQLFYAATLSGILRTPDGGKSWRVATDWDVTEPKSVVVDPNQPDTVYAGVPDGFIVSHDRGLTWARSEGGLPDRGKYTQVVAADRTQAGRVFAGCESGIYLTEDGAKSWRRVFKSSATVNDVQQSPFDPLFWVAVTQKGGAVCSHDGGLSWTKLAGVPSEKALYNVAFDARNPQRVAIASWTYGLLTSEDGGRTWVDRNAGLPEPHRVWRTAIDPDTGRLYASLVEQALYVSDDFGRTWRIGGMVGSRIASFTFVPKAAR